MSIHRLPQEILSQILEIAAILNEKEGATYTFGLIRHTPVPPPTPFTKVVTEKYVRGQLPTEYLKWDTTSSIRKTCYRWHEWALEYSCKDLFIKHRQRNDRWLELPCSQRRGSFHTYESMDLRGTCGHNDPLQSLKNTSKVLSTLPNLAANVKRLWFGVLLFPDNDRFVLDAMSSCPNLRNVTLPWTALRCFGADGWNRIFSKTQLKSLELATIEFPSYAQLPNEDVDHGDLSLVDFSQLRRLKIFGNPTWMPVVDEDLFAIARTATQLEEFYLTCNSTITIAGVFSIVKAAQRTLRVLEHSPRARDGFDHPHPGQLPDNEHICEILTSCPKLRDLSVSIPSMCSTLFSNPDVKWEGDCQVRALNICEHSKGDKTTNQALRQLLNQARELAASPRRRGLDELRMELFFAEFIFDPHIRAVHGDFTWYKEISGDSWPAMSQSLKGPYGATGWYGKEEGPFDLMDEGAFLERVPVLE